MVQFWVAASSAAWGWQTTESGATIPKSFGFEAATPRGATNNVTRNLTYMNHPDFSKENCAVLASISGSLAMKFEIRTGFLRDFSR
jgi:hypothetical protein